MSRRTFRRSTRLLLFGLVLSACGGDDDDGPLGPGDQLGEVDAEVTGDINESVDGMAILIDDGTGGTWTLMMGGADDGDSQVWFGGGGYRAGTGVHVFDDQTNGILGAHYIHGPSEELYVADEGVLTISVSSSTRYTGTFEFTAIELGGDRIVAVEGSFDAEVVDTFDL